MWCSRHVIPKGEEVVCLGHSGAMCCGHLIPIFVAVVDAWRIPLHLITCVSIDIAHVSPHGIDGSHGQNDIHVVVVDVEDQFHIQRQGELASKLIFSVQTLSVLCPFDAHILAVVLPLQAPPHCCTRDRLAPLYW